VLGNDEIDDEIVRCESAERDLRGSMVESSEGKALFLHGTP
jgi:hypothetical protein